MAKNAMEALLKLDGALRLDGDEFENPFTNTLSTPSPSVNFTYGNSWGLPFGFTEAIFGPPKGGKTILLNMKAGQLHRDDPDAIVVRFDTEFRAKGQLTKAQMKLWGIDPKRMIVFQGNTPDMVFDRIEKEVAALCEEGHKIRYLQIDSVSGIRGRRSMNAETVMTQQIGDHALTIKDGMRMILPVQRKFNMAVSVVCQIAAEMDQAEQMRGNKFKMAASYGLQHYAEYFILAEPNKTKEGRTDIHGADFKDEELTDMAGRGEQFAHKIRVTMKDSSLGPKGRVGQFTLDYHKGVINVHEEVFTLGVGRGVIGRPNNLSYTFGDKKWAGKPAMLEALRADTDLQKAIIQELKTRDVQGLLGIVPDAGVETEETEESD